MNSPVVPFEKHTACRFWYERTGTGPYTNLLRMQPLSNRGNTLGETQNICQLRTTNRITGNLQLKRNNTTNDSDTFNAWPFPVSAVNPARSNHLYVAFADRGINGSDKADIFLTYSVNGGTNWTAPTPVNTVWTNDQWMPVLSVKPDGTQLFMAWYDRRNDPNNGLMEVFGRWGTIDTSGSLNLGNEFRITPVSFPQVFAGTDTNNVAIGRYDPVYPPEFVNLHWWYAEWPDDPFAWTTSEYIAHVGEYNGAIACEDSVYFSWTDYRARSGVFSCRYQSDIRLIRLPWPN